MPGERYQDRRQNPRQSDYIPPSEKELLAIMANGDAEVTVNVAERVGSQLARQKLTSHQIRNVYGAARQIQMRWENENDVEAYRSAVLLRPKLAYFAERQKRAQRDSSYGMETLQEALEPALKMLQENGKPSKVRYAHFMDFFEAIVAYHTKSGGK